MTLKSISEERSLISQINEWITTCSICGGKETGPCPKLNNSISPSEPTYENTQRD